MKRNKPVGAAMSAQARQPKQSRYGNSITAGTKTKVENSNSFFNRDALLFSLLAFISFLVIRSLFPVPDYIPDSRGYMYGALKYSEIGYRPMGVSVFLRMLYDMKPSLVFVVWVQLLLHLASGLTLAYGFLSNFTFTRIGRRLLYFICLLNFPLLFLANSITSDSLFTSLTIGWLGLIIFSIKKPNWYLLAGIVFLLWMTMFVRYNAIIYPVISVIAFLLSRKKVFMIAGSVACMAVAWLFYNTIQNRMEDYTGVRIFSGFSGWQLASNAMKAYKTNNKGINTTDPALQWIDKQTITYIDSCNKAIPGYRNSFDVDFIWQNSSPFNKYKNLVQGRSKGDLFTVWANASLKIGEYGKAVIMQYPGIYFTSFILPNAYCFFAPDIEFLGLYMAPEVGLFPEIIDAYKLKLPTNKEHRAVPLYFNMPFRWLYSLLSIAFLGMLVVFVANYRKWKVSTTGCGIILFLAIFWFSKMGFEVLAAPFAFRYVVMTMSPLIGACIVIGQMFMAERRPVTTSAVE